MKKEEIRHDPIRDKIVQFIGSIKENQNIVFTIIGLFVVIILAFGYFQKTSSIKNNNSSNIAGLAQNNFINGEIDEAVVKFERILNDYPITKGAFQASIYLLSDAIKNINYENANKIFNQIEDDIDKLEDPMIASYFYKAKGDIASNDNHNEKAIFNYKLAGKYSNNDIKKAKYDLDISSILIKDEKYPDAKILLEGILLLKDLGFNERNMAEELLAIANHMNGT